LAINAGADLEQRDNYGRMVLLSAIIHGLRKSMLSRPEYDEDCTNPATLKCQEVLRILLAYGADINAQDAIKRTALNWATHFWCHHVA
jgi:ankyrin repeat protein